MQAFHEKLIHYSKLFSPPPAPPPFRHPHYFYLPQPCCFLSTSVSRFCSSMLCDLTFATSSLLFYLLCFICLCFPFLFCAFLISCHNHSHFLHQPAKFSASSSFRQTHKKMYFFVNETKVRMFVNIVTFLTCSSSITGQTKTDKGVDLINAGSSVLAWIRLAVINV